MIPDKLPKDIADKIKADATAAYSDIPGFVAYTKGATAWARWKVKHDELMTLFDKRLTTEQELLKAAKVSVNECQALKEVLQEFVSNHEAGLLPNRFIYEKAIKILNDGKGKEVENNKLHSGNKHKWQDDWDIDEQGELNEETD